MDTQQFYSTLDVSIQPTLNDFLNRINYNYTYQLPYNNNPRILSVQARNGRRIQTLTGKNLLQWNVKREAQRLRINNTCIIILATDNIWNLLLTASQRDQFTALANDANLINQNHVSMINNVDTLNRISRMATPQRTNNNYFEDRFFNGTSFNDHNNDLESLILPAGCLGPSSIFS